MKDCSSCMHVVVCSKYQATGGHVKDCKHFAEDTNVPCKIGDAVWTIRNYNGVPHPQQGFVSEMYFLADMKIRIVVKHLARGEWGKSVFPTYEAALQAIEERSKKHEKRTKPATMGGIQPFEE